MPTPHAVTAFIAFHDADAPYVTILETHLAALCDRGLMTIWHRGKTLPGEDVERLSEQKLQEAQLILLLISADFNSLCNHKLAPVLRRIPAESSSHVVPIILRPCEWTDSPYSGLRPIPHDGSPLVQNGRPDEVRFTSAASEIRRLCTTLQDSDANAVSAITAEYAAVVSTLAALERERYMLERVALEHPAESEQPMVVPSDLDAPAEPNSAKDRVRNSVSRQRSVGMFAGLREAPIQTFCSFCGASRIESSRLIAGSAICICGDCVAACSAFLHEATLQFAMQAPSATLPSAHLQEVQADSCLARLRQSKHTRGQALRIVIAFTVLGVSLAAAYTYKRQPQTLLLSPTQLQVIEARGPIQVKVAVVDRLGGRRPTDAEAWFSADPRIATVDHRGSVLPVSSGSTTLSVFASGLLSRMTVDVRPPAGLVLRPEKLAIATGNGSGALEALVLDDDGVAWPSSTGPTWTSRDPKIAHVDAGQVHCAKGGATTIDVALGALTAEAAVLCPRENVCDNRTDDDADGDVDCDDDDCCDALSCTASLHCQLGMCPDGTVARFYSAKDVPKTILDWGTARSSLLVDTEGLIRRFLVQVGATHTSLGDLRVRIISPSGHNLFIANTVRARGKHFASTILGDHCTKGLKDGTAPYSGCYRPQDPFRKLDGDQAHGTWAIEFADTIGADSGQLLSWSIALCLANAVDGAPDPPYPNPRTPSPHPSPHPATLEAGNRPTSR